MSDSQALSLSFDRDRKLSNNLQPVRKFLRFYLGSNNITNLSSESKDLALLEAEIVTEVIKVSPQGILPVPQMPYCVLGIYSWRSEMLWIVDIENLLGYPPSLEEETTEEKSVLIMVIQFQGQSMGLVVSQIDNIIEQNLTDFQPSSPELFSEDIMPFLHGYFTDRDRITMLIDAEEIFNFFSINSQFNLSQ